MRDMIPHKATTITTSTDDRCQRCIEFDLDGCHCCGPITHTKLYGYDESDDLLLLGLMKLMQSEDTPYGRIGLVFVGEVVRRLELSSDNVHWHPTPEAFRAKLLQLDKAKLIELRPWPHSIRELGATASYCPVAADGTALALIRVVERKQLQHDPVTLGGPCRRCGLSNSPATTYVACFEEGDTFATWLERQEDSVRQLLPPQFHTKPAST